MIFLLYLTHSSIDTKSKEGWMTTRKLTVRANNIHFHALRIILTFLKQNNMKMGPHSLHSLDLISSYFCLLGNLKEILIRQSFKNWEMLFERVQFMLDTTERSVLRAILLNGWYNFLIISTWVIDILNILKEKLKSNPILLAQFRDIIMRWNIFSNKRSNDWNKT
jgi:hypothetical protein